MLSRWKRETTWSFSSASKSVDNQSTRRGENSPLFCFLGKMQRMERRKEVNYYEFRPRGPSLNQPRVVILCEECRVGLDGRVDVLHYGAEMELASITCQQCGFLMTNGQNDPRWHQGVFTDEWEDWTKEFRETRAKQRERIAQKRKR